MPVPTSFSDLSTTVASNSPSGSETPGDGDNHLRTIYALLASIYGNSGNGWSSPYATSAALAALPTLDSNTYTPTYTAVQNVSSTFTHRAARYIRIGSVVYVQGNVTCTTTTSALASFRISLPISSNLSASWQASGVGVAESLTTIDIPAALISDTTNDEAIYSFIADSTATFGCHYSFSYTIA